MSEDQTDVPTEELVPPQQSSPSAPTSDQEKNWKAMRESNRQLKQRLEELENSLKAPKDPEPVFAKDDIPDVGYVDKKIAYLEQQIQAQKLAAVPDRLKAKFSDYESVVTAENIETLKQTEPELYQSLTSGSDLFTVGIAAYKMLKSTGIVKPKETREEEKALEANAVKPRSAHSIPRSGALHDAHNFADGHAPSQAEKDALYREMRQYSKGS